MTTGWRAHWPALVTFVGLCTGAPAACGDSWCHLAFFPAVVVHVEGARLARGEVWQGDQLVESRDVDDPPFERDAASHVSSLGFMRLDEGNYDLVLYFVDGSKIPRLPIAVRHDCSPQSYETAQVRIVVEMESM